jgi:hypothetical protein
MCYIFERRILMQIDNESHTNCGRNLAFVVARTHMEPGHAFIVKMC